MSASCRRFAQGHLHSDFLTIAQARRGLRVKNTNSSAGSIDLDSSKPADICAKLITTRNGRKEAILLSFSKPAIIGRNPALCSYVVRDTLISGVHCKLYAVRSPNAGVILSCQDVSRNGITLNGEPIRKTAVIVMDGDVIRLPNDLSFTCITIWKKTSEKMTLFEPTPPLQPAQKMIGDYIVTSQCLGTGSFATVHLAFDPAKHRQVACKSIRTKRGHEVNQVMKEVRILMTLKHPNINEIYDTEENEKFIHIFLQLCTGGDLFTYITHAVGSGDRICEAEAKYISYQLFEGLRYLHDKSISHRDLKALFSPCALVSNTSDSISQPENILLHCPGPYPRILIADFGLARPNSYQETFNVCGTVSYLPPEGILALDNKHLGYVGMPSDCWSAGVILYIMLAGCHPFDYERRPSQSWITCNTGEGSTNCSQYAAAPHSQADVRLKERIVRGDVEYFQDPWMQIPDAQYLVESLLIRDPLLRATVYSALKSDWIQCEIDDLEALYRFRIEV